MANPAIQFKPGHLYDDIRDRSSESRSENLTARTMAERYAIICRHSLPFFEPQEWRLILHATNGRIEDEHWQFWRHRVTDAIKLEGAAKLFEIGDADKLLAKVKALSAAESIAVLDFCERHWAAVECGNEPSVPGEEP